MFWALGGGSEEWGRCGVLWGHRPARVPAPFVPTVPLLRLSQHDSGAPPTAAGGGSTLRAAQEVCPAPTDACMAAPPMVAGGSLSNCGPGSPVGTRCALSCGAGRVPVGAVACVAGEWVAASARCGPEVAFWPLHPTRRGAWPQGPHVLFFCVSFSFPTLEKSELFLSNKILIFNNYSQIRVMK